MPDTPQKRQIITREQALRDVHSLWRWNGDWMACRSCLHSIHVSCADETPRHAAECSTSLGPNPWRVLLVALNDPFAA